LGGVCCAGRRPFAPVRQIAKQKNPPGGERKRPGAEENCKNPHGAANMQRKFLKIAKTLLIFLRGWCILNKQFSQM